MRSKRQHPHLVLIALTVVVVSMTVASGGGVARAAILDPSASPTWTLMFANPGNDAATDAVMTPALTWVCGQSSTVDHSLDATLIRIVNGTSVSSTHSYDGPAHQNDAAYDVAARGSWIYTSGATRRAADNLDLLVVRWTPAGAVKWARSYGSAGKNPDVGVDVGVDGKGNVVACGTRTGANGEDWVVASWSPTGTRRWLWTYNGAADVADTPREMYVDKTGNTYVTGLSWVSAATNACVTVKLSPSGKRLWLRKYTGPEGTGAFGQALAACPGGGVYVGGFTREIATGMDGMLLRYSARGKRTVYAAYSGGGASPVEEIHAIAVARGGAIVGVGRAVNASDDPLRIVWSPAGSILDHDIDTTVPPYGDAWTDVAADGVGGYCMTGTWPNAPSDLSVRTFRESTFVDSGQWAYVWDGPVDTKANIPNAVAANGTSYVVVGAYEAVGGGMNQFVQFWRY